MRPSLFIDDYPFPRPADIPAGWEIWNAARPLNGHPHPVTGEWTWEGAMRAGSWYAVIDPSQPDADSKSADNVSLDGHPCRWVTMAEIREWARGYYARFKIDPDEYDDDDVAHSYVLHQGETPCNS